MKLPGWRMNLVVMRAVRVRKMIRSVMKVILPMVCRPGKVKGWFVGERRMAREPVDIVEGNQFL